MKDSELRKLEEICGSYEFTVKMTELSDLGRNGDRESTELLIAMLSMCGSRNQWFARNTWCSMAARALIQTRTRESLQFILRFIRDLPDQTPFGAVDLIAGLLPLYGSIITGHAVDLASEGQSEILRALGIQTLCNMYLEGLLSSEHSAYLDKIIRSFKGDRYFTQQITEIVRSSMLSDSRRGEDTGFLASLTGAEDLNDEIMNMIQGEL